MNRLWFLVIVLLALGLSGCTKEKERKIDLPSDNQRVEYDPESFEYSNIDYQSMIDDFEEEYSKNHVPLTNATSQTQAELSSFLNNARSFIPNTLDGYTNPNENLFNSTSIVQKNSINFDDGAIKFKLRDYPVAMISFRLQSDSLNELIDTSIISENQYIKVNYPKHWNEYTPDEYMKVVLEDNQMDIYLVRFFESDLEVIYYRYKVGNDGPTFYMLRCLLDSEDRVTESEELYHSNSKWYTTNYKYSETKGNYSRGYRYRNLNTNDYFRYSYYLGDTYGSEDFDYYNIQEELLVEYTKFIGEDDDRVVLNKYHDEALVYSSYDTSGIHRFQVSLTVFPNTASFKNTGDESIVYYDNVQHKLEGTSYFEVWNSPVITFKSTGDSFKEYFFDFSNLPAETPLAYEEYYLLKETIKTESALFMQLGRDKRYNTDLDTTIFKLEEIKALDID